MLQLSTSDKPYLSYYDASLTVGDVKSLKNDWLSDNVITFWQEYLERETLPRYPQARICLLRPSMAFLLMRTQTQDMRQINNTLPNLAKATHIFLPINDNHNVGDAEGGSHWSLLLVSVLDGVAFHYDSLGGANYSEGNLTTRKLSQVLGRQLRFVNLEDSPQQENGSDCGVFVCLLMRHLLVKRLLSANAREKVSMSMAGKMVDSHGGRKEMLRIIDNLRKEAERRRSSASWADLDHFDELVRDAYNNRRTRPNIVTASGSHSDTDTHHSASSHDTTTFKRPTSSRDSNTSHGSVPLTKCAKSSPFNPISPTSSSAASSSTASSYASSRNSDKPKNSGTLYKYGRKHQRKATYSAKRNRDIGISSKEKPQSHHGPASKDKRNSRRQSSSSDECVPRTHGQHRKKCDSAPKRNSRQQGSPFDSPELHPQRESRPLWSSRRPPTPEHQAFRSGHPNSHSQCHYFHGAAPVAHTYTEEYVSTEAQPCAYGYHASPYFS
ncbi:hypothetical protein NLG97_g8850 [Lecanicillium saksenae]|uniref:Uncharacterized protein n=1 Tax=Lecanicillium saksenae TaxID=468837 RepID=A0ACC1QKP5_9HYPO|nr:hypothetical protein NLG97_g8850 [Lecanicillium saksenae]